MRTAQARPCAAHYRDLRPVEDGTSTSRSRLWAIPGLHLATSAGHRLGDLVELRRRPCPVGMFAHRCEQRAGDGRTFQRSGLVIGLVLALDSLLSTSCLRRPKRPKTGCRRDRLARSVRAGRPSRRSRADGWTCARAIGRNGDPTPLQAADARSEGQVERPPRARRRFVHEWQRLQATGLVCR